MPGLAGRNRPGSPEVTLGITELANSDDGFTLSVRTGARRLRLSSRRFRVCRAPFDMAAQGDRLFCRDRRGEQRGLQLANFRRALIGNAVCFGFACVAQAISQLRFDFAKHRLQRVLHGSIVGRGRHGMSSGLFSPVILLTPCNWRTRYESADHRWLPQQRLEPSQQSEPGSSPKRRIAAFDGDGKEMPAASTAASIRPSDAWIDWARRARRDHCDPLPPNPER